MAPITALAAETLQLIFAQINSTKHLAQCRLVCSDFNAIAEKAILDCPIVIQTEDQAFSLLQHLAKCQQKGIKHFCWGLELPARAPTPQVFKHLLPWILTSDTVSISGVVEGEEFYALIEDLVEQLAEKPKLTALPHPRRPNRDYYHSLIKCRTTLQSAYVYLMEPRDINKTPISTIFGFPQLKSLVIRGNVLNMQDFLVHFASMESNLQLNELELYIQCITVEEIRAIHGVLEINRIEPHVKQSVSMKTLTLHGDCPAIFVETLMFMYPKLESVSLCVQMRSSMSSQGICDQVNRILDCIEHIAHKELTITSPNSHPSGELIFHLTGKGYSVNIPATRNASGIRMIVGGWS